MTTCAECGKTAKLVHGDRIYPHRPDLFSKQFYLCECGAYCGCHGSTTDPLGQPCGPKTRLARQLAHLAFDSLWKSGRMTRKEAYKWLSDTLCMAPEKCHIGMMNSEEAMAVVDVSIERVGEP